MGRFHVHRDPCADARQHGEPVQDALALRPAPAEDMEGIPVRDRRDARHPELWW